VSSLTTEQGIVHYEVYGRGRPVILLHGWLGSWGLWQETMTFLGGNYRAYALDFWGFGESGKKRDSYKIEDFVLLLDEFMDRLGIIQAPLVGHSMGGTVSLATAIRFPERVSKVTVIGSPIDGHSLTLPLRLASKRRVAEIVHRWMWGLKFGIRLAAPLITRDRRWYEMIARDLSQTTLDSFLLSIASLYATDLTTQLHEIQAPTLGIYGTRDNIVHPKQWQPLSAHIPNAEVKIIEKAGHFPMLDAPDTFQDTLTKFLASDHSAT